MITGVNIIKVLRFELGTSRMPCKFRTRLWKGYRRLSNTMSASRLLRKDFHICRYFADCAGCRFTASIRDSETRSYVPVAAGCFCSYKALAAGNVAWFRPAVCVNCNGILVALR